MSLASVSAVSASPARAGYSAALPVMGAAASVAGMKVSGNFFV